MIISNINIVKYHDITVNKHFYVVRYSSIIAIAIIVNIT